MKINFKIIVFLGVLPFILLACHKRCETFDPDGSYTATIHYSYSKSGGSPPVPPESSEKTYTDVLIVHTTDSPYHLSIENWPNGGGKIVKTFEVKRGESEESNEDTKPKECFETAYSEPYDSNGSARLLIGKGSLTYNSTETIGGSGGMITQSYTITANR